MNSDLLYVIYVLGKRGVTIGIRVGRSSQVVESFVSCDGWILSSCFSYYCSLCNELKQRLTTTPILILPKPDEPFVVYRDASKLSLGGVLM